MATHQAAVKFNDGVYGVMIGRHSVAISKLDGPTFNVPNGHAWYDRVAEASTRAEVEDLHTELVAALGEE